MEKVRSRLDWVLLPTFSSPTNSSFIRKHFIVFFSDDIRSKKENTSIPPAFTTSLGIPTHPNEKKSREREWMKREALAIEKRMQPFSGFPLMLKCFRRKMDVNQSKIEDKKCKERREQKESKRE